MTEMNLSILSGPSSHAPTWLSKLHKAVYSYSAADRNKEGEKPYQGRAAVKHQSPDVDFVLQTPNVRGTCGLVACARCALCNDPQRLGEETAVTLHTPLPRASVPILPKHRLQRARVYKRQFDPLVIMGRHERVAIGAVLLALGISLECAHATIGIGVALLSSAASSSAISSHFDEEYMLPPVKQITLATGATLSYHEAGDDDLQPLILFHDFALGVSSRT
eukprot:6190801-Pleurochrysis_carterae.AAC.1